MRLIITENVGAWAARYVKEKVSKFNPLENKKFVLGLPSGGTAISMYKNIVDLYNKKQISFKNIITFNMDEYIGLPKNHPKSYWTFMHQNLFNLVEIDTSQINIPNGNALDIKQECTDYENKILQVGGINLFIGGVGENGHIAFNEPFSSLSSKTRDKELNKNTLKSNSRFFDDDINKVPKSAITIGIDTLLKSEEVMILITGENKARALKQCLEGAISQACPISILQMHSKAIIVADEASCGELKVNTYRFFKELEDEYSYIENIS